MSEPWEELGLKFRSVTIPVLCSFKNCLPQLMTESTNMPTHTYSSSLDGVGVCDFIFVLFFLTRRGEWEISARRAAAGSENRPGAWKGLEHHGVVAVNVQAAVLDLRPREEGLRGKWEMLLLGAYRYEGHKTKGWWGTWWVTRCFSLLVHCAGMEEFHISATSYTLLSYWLVCRHISERSFKFF